MRIRNNNKLSKVILDSGPLLILLTLNYIEFYNKQNKDTIIRKVYSNFDNIPNPVYNLNRFFKEINYFHTTPHAIGEVIGLVKSRLKLKDNENEFWISSFEFIKRNNFSEHLISLVELAENNHFTQLISQIGVVDSELINFAQESNMPIISIDKRTLKKEAEKRNVEVLIIDDDIYNFLDFSVYY